MKNCLKKLLECVRKKAYSAYKFLEENGFFSEMIRKVMDLVFYIIISYYLKL